MNDVSIGHTIDLPGRLARFVMAYVDNIIYIHADGSGNRKLLFRPHQGIEAGSRHPVLARAGSCDASYEALRALFEEVQDEGDGVSEPVGEGGEETPALALEPEGGKEKDQGNGRPRGQNKK